MKINCYMLLYQLLKSKWSPRENISSSFTTVQSTNYFKHDVYNDLKIHGRALHYSFKIGDRKRTVKFYKDILGMKILRHEESSNSNEMFNDRWSKTMVGYGAEDDYFTFELIYNYPIHNYLKGNEFISVTIRSSEVIRRARSQHWPILDGNILEAPGGYRFHILDEPQPHKHDPIVKITLACSDFKKSLYYWHNILGLILYERDNRKKSFAVGFKSNEVKLEFQQIEQMIQRGDQIGRIYFSCPYYQQPEIIDKIRERRFKVIVPLVPLENTGLGSVRILILGDPDGHEVCFVDDLAFRQISQYSPEDEINLQKFIEIENEKNHIIGEPAKKAEFKLIEESVKKTQDIKNIKKGYKDVLITLPVTNVMSKNSSNSNRSNSSMKTKETNCPKSTVPQKLTVKVTKTKSKKSRLPLPSQTHNNENSTTQSNSHTSQNLSEDSDSDFISSSSSTNLKCTQPTDTDDIEALVKSVMFCKLEEKISFQVSKSLEATVSRVVAEKINETVNKVVTEKIVETVATAVAQIEDSMKMNAPKLLPVIHEEGSEVVHSFPCLLQEKDRRGKIPRRCPRRVNRRGRISGS